MGATMTDEELAAIEARAAAMIASADDLERDEPDIAAVAGKIRAHGRELAALAAEVRRLRRQRPADVLAVELVRAVAGSAAGLSDAESRARHVSSVLDATVDGVAYVVTVTRAR